MDTPIEFTLKNWSRTYIICPILNKNKYVSHLMQLFCKVHTDWLGLCKVRAESARTRSDSAESVRSPHGQVGHCKLLWELSIQLWTLSGELIESWVFNYGHCPVSSLRAEYSTTDTLGWAHWELSIELPNATFRVWLRTISGDPSTPNSTDTLRW